MARAGTDRQPQRALPRTACEVSSRPATRGSSGWLRHLARAEQLRAGRIGWSAAGYVFHQRTGLGVFAAASTADSRTRLSPFSRLPQLPDAAHGIAALRSCHGLAPSLL